LRFDERPAGILTVTAVRYRHAADRCAPPLDLHIRETREPIDEYAFCIQTLALQWSPILPGRCRDLRTLSKGVAPVSPANSIILSQLLVVGRTRRMRACGTRRPSEAIRA